MEERENTQQRDRENQKGVEIEGLLPMDKIKRDAADTFTTKGL